MQIRDAVRVLQRRHSLRKQLSGLVLEVQKIVGAYFLKNLPQCRPVWPENKKLGPEPLRLLAIVRLVLFARALISGYSLGRVGRRLGCSRGGSLGWGKARAGALTYATELQHVSNPISQPNASRATTQLSREMDEQRRQFKP